MGFFDFISEKGAQLFGIGTANADEKANNIVEYVNKFNFPVENLLVNVEGDTAVVTGTTDETDTAERVILAVGNVEGISKVDDQITVRNPAGQTRFYTVKSGDSLSKISKEFYGDPMKYPVIFEANKPMLTHPDKIYPGQALRIPFEH